MHTLHGLTNDALLLHHARPGMMGMLAAWSPERFIPDLLRYATGARAVGGSGQPSLWSHCFAVVDRRVREGWEEIVIVESTWIPPEHRMDPASSGDPDWDGPQRSVVLARRVGDGRLRGHDERRSLRRYRDGMFTPNLALFDLGLRPEQLSAFRARVTSSLEPRHRYAGAELVGTLIAGLTGRMEQPNPLDTPDSFCSGYVRALFDGLSPALDSLAIHTTNTSPDAMYHHLRERVPCWQVLRSVQPRRPSGREALAELGTLQL